MPRPCHVTGMLALALVLSSGVVYAAEWNNKAGATVSTILTDNVYLSETNEESDLIPIISPFWNISGEGGGATLNVIGSFDVKDPGGDQGENNLNLQAFANAELVDRILFIDARAASSQNAINPLSTSGTNSLGKSDNRTTTQTITLSPYVIGHIKNYADFQARYARSYVTSSEIDNGDTRSSDLDLSLNSGSRFGGLLWGLSATDRTTDAQSGSSTDKSSLSANLGYQLNRNWQVNGLVGEEWTDFTSNGDTGGINWELGAVWTPSVRTSIDVGYGRRFSGPTGHLNLSHRSRRSLFTASYSQEITDNSEQLSAHTDSAGYNSALNEYILDVYAGNFLQLLIDNSTGNLRPGAPDPGDYLSIISDNVQFLSDRFAMGYILSGRRTTLILSGDYTKHTGIDASETIGTGLNATVKRDLSGQLSATAGLSLDRIEQDGGSQSDLWNLNFGLSQKLSGKTTLNLNVVHAKRDSDSANESYDENRIGLSLKHYLR